MTVGRCAAYMTAFILGFGTCYTSCVNKEYKIVEENGRIYVQDNKTGRRQQVDADFKDKSPEKTLSRRVDDMYNALTR